MSLEVVILAAGAGKRMRSSLPKVLHQIGGRCLLEHVVNTARQLSPLRVHVVYGHGGDMLRSRLAHLDVNWVEQKEQAGTGHAVRQALPHLGEGKHILILYGDVPLLSVETIHGLLAQSHARSLALLTTRLIDPSGYGRILRDAADGVMGIVEHRDASLEQRCIDEVNSGIMVVPVAVLTPWLHALKNDNDQREYYLTDIIAAAVADGVQVNAVSVADPVEVMGVNDRVQLAVLERHYQKTMANRLMLEGVTLRDPGRLDIRGDVEVGQDVEIDVDVILEGKVVLGNDVRIGPFCRIRDAHIAGQVTIHSHSVIEEAEIGPECRIGPYARIRPASQLAAHVRIGNFVEIKKSRVAQGSKVNHLSYIGDTDIGKGVNIGAGTITCNYDGANKFRTVIEDDVFIGSDTQLVAPVSIGRGATIGAGSTITRDVPADELTLSRTAQKTKLGWKRPIKQS